MRSQADGDGSSASGGAAVATKPAHQQVKSSQELQQVNHYGQVEVRGTRKSPRRGGRNTNKNKTSNFNSKSNSTTQGQDELVQNANLFPSSSSWGSGSAATNSGSRRADSTSSLSSAKMSV